MNTQTNNRDVFLIALAGALPVAWLALLIAPYWNGSIFDLVSQLDAILEDPMHIKYHEYYEKNPEEAKDDSSEKSSDTSKKKAGKKKSNNNALNYSTNTSDTVKDGDKGVYAYKKKGESYHQYYIIDFDEGYVYYFTEGNGSDSCERVKMESGNLNDVLIITFHDGGDTWSYGMHFKYKNNPETLIVEDNDHFEDKFTATSLSDALKLREKKEMHDY